MSDIEKRRRAAEFALGSVCSDGFKPSKEVLDMTEMWVEGEISMSEFMVEVGLNLDIQIARINSKHRQCGMTTSTHELEVNTIKYAKKIAQEVALFGQSSDKVKVVEVDIGGEE